MINLRKVGSLEQLGGVQRVILNDGPSKGVEAAIFRTGTGLSFTVLLDRGMDIGQAEWCGKSLAWRSAAGDAHPSRYEADGIGWLRGFGGGLVTTCGLTYAGAPNVDQGEALGLHGRMSNIPASAVAADCELIEGRYELFARGRVTEAVPVVGQHVELNREIRTAIGSNTISVKDRVVNRGWSRTPFALLYHVNLGYPLLDESTEIRLPSRAVVARDAASEPGLAEWQRFRAPEDGVGEQCLFHDLAADADGYVTTAMINRQAGFGLELRYRQAELPKFQQWRFFGSGAYVMGFEPSNCSVLGRAHDRANGILQYLEPGETRELHIELTVISPC